MNILYFIPHINEHGGIQSFGKEQAKIFQNKKNVFIVLKNWTSPYTLLGKIIRSFGPSRTGASLYHKMLYKQFSLDIEYDIVHHWIFFSAIGLSHKNNIITCHGNEILTKVNFMHRKFTLIKTLNEARYITTPSSFTKNYIVDNYHINKDKIFVIHPGIELSQFSLTYPKNKIYKIGTLTRFVKRKNIVRIIDALIILKQKYNISFEYHLAGDGPEKSNIIRALENSNITWKYLGKVTDEYKIKNFYPSLDLYVLPPLELLNDVEGFGIVFLEANACGAPVVASATGGISDAVKPGASGLFANPKNPEDMANKMLEILTSKKDYRKSSRKWAENFSQEKTAEQFMKLYRSL
jgi:phosphatidyl-myo-inositol dimannoside synthase